ncbi:MAG: hypothetical protein WCI67_04600 [Chloroflexales bacterium]
MTQTPEFIADLIADLCTGDESQRTQASFGLSMLGDPAVRYEPCRALVDLRVPDGVGALREVAEQDTGETSWGSVVCEGVRRAMAELEQ